MEKKKFRAEQIIWDETAEGYAHRYGLSREDVMKIVNTARSEMDPHSQEVGHPIIRFISADVTAVVGFRDPKRPKLMGVYVNEHLEGRHHTFSKPKAKQDYPRNSREFKKRAVNYGYYLDPGRGGDLVTTREGKVLGFVPANPGEGELDKAWRHFQSQHIKHTTTMVQED